MTVYQPDNWVILQIKNPDSDPIYKVLGGWSGSYLDGSSWRLNSGIERIEDKGNHWEVFGSSGSSYLCHKESEHLRLNNAGILASFQKKAAEVGSEILMIPIEKIMDQFLVK